jgi:hypothetical protein
VHHAAQLELVALRHELLLHLRRQMQRLPGGKETSILFRKDVQTYKNASLHIYLCTFRYTICTYLYSYIHI